MKFFTTRFLNKMQNIYSYPAIYKSKQFYKACFCTAFIFFLSCSIPSSSAGENVGDIIILFDQSASMKEHDPKSISKAWLITFIKTFKKPHNVLLVGFDDRIHQHAKVTMKNKKDVETLRDNIKRIGTRGVTTDMEAPLSYLLERNDKHPIAFAVIISDGEQEIWDEKRWYLSTRIRTDNRYEDLNKQYRSLKAQGVSFKQIYNRLKGLYHARNLNFINERLAKLKEKIGKKLVFLDISGDFEFFKKWAKATNAQYILANARGKEDPVEALRGAIIALQERASDVLQEQLPSDYEERVEPVTEPQEKAEIPVKPPAASDKALPPIALQKKESDIPGEQLPSDHIERVEPAPAEPQEDTEIPVFEPSPEPEPPVKLPAASDKESPPLKTDIKETDKKEPSKEQLPTDIKESMEPVPEPQEDAEIPVVEPSPEPELPVKPPAASDKESPPLKTDIKEADKQEPTKEQLPTDLKESMEPVSEPQEDAEIPVLQPSPEPETPVKPLAAFDKESPPLKTDIKEADKQEPTKEQLPTDLKESMEPISEPQEEAEIPVFELSPEPETPVKPPAASDTELPPLKTDIKEADKQEPAKEQLPADLKETAKKDLPVRWMIFLTIIVILIVAFFSAVLFRFRKKAKLSPEEFEGTKDKMYTNKPPEQADVKLKNLSLRSIKDTNKFIENEIQTAINDAGKEQVKLLEAEKDKLQFDKRSFLSIPLQTGAMIVHWINKNGEHHQGNATNISMNEVMFEAAGFNEGSIDTIECPGMGITFHVKQSRIIRKDGSQVVAALDEFRYNIDDRIKWVETLTRIEEGAK